MLEKLDLTSCATLRNGPIVPLIKDLTLNGEVATVGTLFMDRHPSIEPEAQDWLGRNIPSFSCVYTRKKRCQVETVKGGKWEPVDTNL